MWQDTCVTNIIIAAKPQGRLTYIHTYIHTLLLLWLLLCMRLVHAPLLIPTCLWRWENQKLWQLMLNTRSPSNMGTSLQPIATFPFQWRLREFLGIRCIASLRRLPNVSGRNGMTVQDYSMWSSVSLLLLREAMLCQYWAVWVKYCYYCCYCYCFPCPVLLLLLFWTLQQWMAGSVAMHDGKMTAKRMLRDNTILVWCSLFCMRACMIKTVKMRTVRIRVRMRLKVVPQKGRKLAFDGIVRLWGINSWFCILEMDNSIEVKMSGGSCMAEVVRKLCWAWGPCV